MKFIPGFRTKKVWKMVVAVLYYLIALTSISQGFAFFLLILSIPFVVFYAIDFFKQLKNLKKATEGQNEERRSFNQAAMKFIAVAVIFIIVIAALPNTRKAPDTVSAVAGDTTAKVTTASQIQPKAEPGTTKAEPASTTKKAVTPEKVNFSTMELNTENVLKALKDVVDDDKLKNVEITTENGLQIVDVYFDPGMVWDEKDLVNQTAISATAAMEVLFTNTKVDKVWFWTSTKMTDAKGNENDENVINVCLTKENAKDINWPKFKEMVLVDYNKLFNIADKSFIYPGIKSKLN